MLTQVEFTAEELEVLQKLTECADPARAIKIATDEYVRYRLRLELIEMSGKFEMLDNWRELDQAELDDDPYGLERDDR